MWKSRRRKLNSALKIEASKVRPMHLRLNALMRWLHIYTSMLSLIVVLFFALTGITLNHPDWLFGTSETRTQSQGALPANWLENNKVNWLVVVEELRDKHNLKGKAIDMQSSQLEASLRFAAPGYTADALIEADTGKYTLNISSQGIVAAMNDFHRGRNAGAAWAVLIDVAGWFLVFISATGLGLLFYLKKIRLKAMLVMFFGGAAMIALMQWLF